ncbi:MAG TPA: hypothetical protein VGM96_04300 [Reyranella sp.]|jgi:hypothetical protein
MPQRATPIDVWNIGTFDRDLLAQLLPQANLVRNYMTTDHQIFLDHGLGRARDVGSLRPTNPWSAGFQMFKEQVGRLMVERTIRAWHYTRLTDAEVVEMQSAGIHMSTPTTLRNRLDALASKGELTGDVADALYHASPFHSDQLDARKSKFWMVSHPLAVDDSGVSRLLKYWGGEVASFWTEAADLLELLRRIGRPRVIELAVPISSAGKYHWYSAGEAIVATFGRSLGCIPDKHSFDLYAIKPLPASAVPAVHTEGEPSYARIGRDFPCGFVNVDVGRWRELTGEEDE